MGGNAMTRTILCSTSTSLFGMRPLRREDLELTRQCGIDHIELAIRPNFSDPNDPDQTALLERAVANGVITIHSGHTDWSPALDISVADRPPRSAALEIIRNGIDILARLGGKVLVFHPSQPPMATGDVSDRLAAARETIIELTDHARRRGVRLAPEIMAPPCVPNMSEQAVTLLAGTDPAWVGICFDVNHGNLSADPARAIRALGSRIIHYHISDNDGVAERHWMPFEGVIDWPGVMAAIRETGYAGALNYEVGMAPFDDDATLERTLRERRVVFDRLMAL